MTLPPSLERRLSEELDQREEERRHGFTLKGLHGQVTKLTDSFAEHEARIKALEEADVFPPVLVRDRLPTIPEVEIEAPRVPSDRAASISMSAPFGARASFKGRDPTRFAMGLLLIALAAGAFGFAMRSMVTVNASPPSSGAAHEHEGAPKHE